MELPRFIKCLGFAHARMGLGCSHARMGLVALLCALLALPAFAGETGFSGDTGHSGFAGETGFSGDTGHSGFAGEAGFSGDTGHSGFAREAGFDGKTTRIRGRVTDARTGQPVECAAVFFPTTTIGTTTDKNGEFSLSARDTSLTQLRVQLLGYVVVEKNIMPGTYNEVKVFLLPERSELAAARVVPDESRARALLEAIESARLKGDPDEAGDYACDIYSRLELDIPRPQEQLRSRAIRKQWNFIYEYVDTSEVSGEPFLPVLVNESVSRRLHPIEGDETEEITATRMSGADPSSGNILAEFTGAAHLKCNFYARFIDVLGVNVPSPARLSGLQHYDYYIIDTLDIAGRKSVLVRFHPRKSAAGPVFDGEMTVDLEDMVLRSVKARVGQGSGTGINWVKFLQLEQSFVKLASGRWFFRDEKLLADLSVDPGANLDIQESSPSTKQLSVTALRTVSFGRASFGETFDTGGRGGSGGGGFGGGAGDGLGGDAGGSGGDGSGESGSGGSAEDGSGGSGSGGSGSGESAGDGSGGDSMRQQMRGGAKVSIAKDAQHRDEAYWEAARPYPLSERERGVFRMVDKIKETPLYSNLSNIVTTIIVGYWTIGKSKSDGPSGSSSADGSAGPLQNNKGQGIGGKLSIGPCSKFVSYNPLEGLRLRAGLRTTRAFSSTDRLTGHVAYGVRDKEWKGGVSWEHMFSHSPTAKLSLDAHYDTQQLGKGMNPFTQGNIFSSLAGGGSHEKLIYCAEASALFEHELSPGINWSAMLACRRQYGNHILPLGGHISSADANATMRFSRDETVLRGYFVKTYISTKYPVWTISLTGGICSVGAGSTSSVGATGSTSSMGAAGGTSDVVAAGGAGDARGVQPYFRPQVAMDWRLPLPPIGVSTIHIDAGAVLGQVPFTLLHIHEGNCTRLPDRTAFSTMNYFEFASDRWATLMWEHNFYGLLFNRIPFIKRLGLRESIGAKVAWGSLSAKNGPDQALVAFPSGMQSLSGKPFVELSCGITNILSLLRVDFNWRLTHRDGYATQIPPRNFVVNIGVELKF